MVLVEMGCGQYAGEWAGEAERQWKQRTIEGRKAKEEMDREEERRVVLRRFQDSG